MKHLERRITFLGWKVVINNQNSVVLDQSAEQSIKGKESLLSFYDGGEWDYSMFMNYFPLVKLYCPACSQEEAMFQSSCSVT